MSLTNGFLGAKRIALAIAATVTALLACVGEGGLNEGSVAQSAQRPNIVFVLTDDNDARTYQDFMPRTNRLIGDAGVTFENATYGHSLCCPSRASILRGQYPHNTGVFKNSPPNGGFETFMELGENDDTYATDLKAAGYRTGYFGKYMNGYENFLTYKPPGWNYWFSGAPMGRQYSLNGQVKTAVGDTTYREARFDQLVADKGIRWIHNASGGTKPFMAALSFYAPHYPAEHPPEYDELYTDTPLPKPPSYDESDLSDKPGWLQDAPPISLEEEQSMTEYYRNRLRSVEFVDKQVARLVRTLRNDGMLKNTYIVFYSDNGYHLGEHRLPGYDHGGKATPYIEDVRFPIVVRGPGITAGRPSQAMVQNVDLRPTFGDMAGIQTPDYVDGASFLPEARGMGTFSRRYAYSERLESGSGPTIEDNADWKAVYTPDMAYHYWFRTGEEELYDLSTDPYQLENLAGERPEEETVLKARLEALGTCAGDSCRTAEDTFASISGREKP